MRFELCYAEKPWPKTFSPNKAHATREKKKKEQNTILTQTKILKGTKLHRHFRRLPARAAPVRKRHPDTVERRLQPARRPRSVPPELVSRRRAPSAPSVTSAPEHRR